MVFVVLQIRSASKILKSWVGVTSSESTVLRDIYNDFTSGVVDKLECIPNEFNTVKICASVGKTKNEQTPVDLNAPIGDVVSVLGNFIDFNVTRTDEGTGPSAANQHEKKSCFQC